ncbi:glycosyltransferase family 2 protein [Nocardioides cynanchi]|uniref:glycosyltransferase family 2 protein n=1 Tax=Nocardioides cynanchi TaxID=2558918 RepID=UPI0012441D43|nr:glycosyltransferase family 2 protein [Nocardioides cynanchi]
MSGDDVVSTPLDHRDGETVAVVVVTHNRADLLGRTLDGLAAQTHEPDSVIVVDNASEDHTRAVLDAHRGLHLQRIHLEENTGGAGGFRAGVAAAFDQGFDRIWLMDDDVVPAPDCLAELMAQDEAFVMAVREDTHGHLVEKAATDFDLTRAWAVHPKRSTVETDFGDRDAMPERVELHNIAFEGPLFRREVVATIGLPDSSFFIFYDDVDFAVRARRAGYRIWAIRDAVLVRQLDFSQQHDLSGWKGYYMYRNMFAVHFRYGESRLVRAKPWAIAAAVVAISPVRGGRAEASNVIRAVRDARGMRSIPGSGTPPR